MSRNNFIPAGVITAKHAALRSTRSHTLVHARARARDWLVASYRELSIWTRGM